MIFDYQGSTGKRMTWIPDPQESLRHQYEIDSRSHILTFAAPFRNLIM